MANPASFLLPLTGDTFVDATTHGYQWSFSGAQTLNWAIAGGFGGEFWHNPSSVAATLAGAFKTISDVANISFNYTGFHNDPVAAYVAGSDITFSLDESLISSVFGDNVWAIGASPSTSWVNDLGYAGAPGDIFLNINSAANSISYEPGAAGYALALHEIGHTLGLKHPHDDGGTGSPTFSELGISDLDIDVASVMSYNDDYNWNNTQFDPATPMLLDTLALQYIFGANTSTFAGNDTHNLALNNFYSTLWDAGGSDWVSVRSSSKGWSIELPNVQLSSLVNTLAGYAIPSDEMSLNSPHTFYWLTGNIENVMGSAHADWIQGSDGVNTLRGMNGNDFINGNGGKDWIIADNGNDKAFGGDGLDFVRGAAGNDVIGGDAGNDFVWGDAGNDTVYGGDGNDHIIGGPGQDNLYGGRGADRFYFENGSDVDMVRDFAHGIDFLKIVNNVNGSGIDSFADISSHISVANGVTSIDIGGGHVINLSGEFELNDTDFIFY